MTTIGLRAIDAEFIVGLGNLSQKSQGRGAAINLQGGGAASRVELGLRSGATIYAQAINGLSNLGGALNLVKDNLGSLLDLTEEMQNLAERSSKVSTSKSSRGKLDFQFRKAANEFRDILDDAVVDDKDILTKEGLTELFVLVGLDPEKSDSLADVLSDFEVPDGGEYLASEKVKGRTLRLSASLPPPDKESKILDGDIRDRSNAYQALNGLEALQKQIESNIDNVDSSLEYLQANVDIVRAAGLAMLNLSNEGLSASDVENIADLLQREIRKLARAGAISLGAQNLEPIAVATLVNVGDDKSSAP